MDFVAEAPGAPAAPQALWRAVADAAGRPYTAPPPGALLRPYAPEQPLPYAHYTQALDAARQLPPGALRGQLVLLGQHTPVGGQDQHATALRLLGTGTQSGPLPGQGGSLLELSVGGKQPVALPGGETRSFLQDGDTLFLRAHCERAGARRIGFGECRGTVLPARAA